MILRPQENFTVVRVLSDHTDSNTYYVRAVIRNSKTDAIIATLNLTNTGNRRFTKVWQVPEMSDDLMFIDIVSTVYTDSAYTTKSSLYYEETNTYQVERLKRNTGGGMSVDYELINKNIEKIVKKLIIENVEKPKDITIPTYDESILAKSIKEQTGKLLIEMNQIKSKIENINIPEPKEIDLSKDFEMTIENIVALQNKINEVINLQSQATYDFAMMLNTLRGDIQKIKPEIKTIVRPLEMVQIEKETKPVIKARAKKLIWNQE